VFIPWYSFLALNFQLHYIVMTLAPILTDLMIIMRKQIHYVAMACKL